MIEIDSEPAGSMRRRTTGTATLTLQHDANNSVTFNFPQLAFQMAENTEPMAS